MVLGFIKKLFESKKVDDRTARRAPASSTNVPRIDMSKIFPKSERLRPQIMKSSLDINSHNIDGRIVKSERERRKSDDSQTPSNSDDNSVSISPASSRTGKLGSSLKHSDSFVTYEAHSVEKQRMIDYCRLLGISESESTNSTNTLDPNQGWNDLVETDEIGKMKKKYSASTLAIFPPKKLLENGTSASINGLELYKGFAVIGDSRRRTSEVERIQKIPTMISNLTSALSWKTFSNYKFPENLSILYNAYLFDSNCTSFRITAILLSVIFIIFAGFTFSLDVHFGNKAVILIICVAIAVIYTTFFIISFRRVFETVYSHISFVSALLGSVPFILAVPMIEVEPARSIISYSSKLIIYIALVYIWWPISVCQKIFLGLLISILRIVFLLAYNGVEFIPSDVLILSCANLLGIYFSFAYSIIFRRSFISARIFFQNQQILEKARFHSEKLLKNILPVQIIDEFKQVKKKLFKKNSMTARNVFLPSNVAPYSLQSIQNVSKSDSISPDKGIGSLESIRFEGMTNNRNSLLAGVTNSITEHTNITIMFADIVGFTEFASTVSADYLVRILSVIFEKFDIFAEALGLEKIKTIGDCYQVCGGIPETPTSIEEAIRYAKKVCTMASCMLKVVEEVSQEANHSLRLRIGIHTGAVYAGIVGESKFKYDVWSEDVRIAGIMEQTSEPSLIQISAETAKLLEGDRRFIITPRKNVDIGDSNFVEAFKLVQIWSHSIELVFPKEIVSKLNKVESQIGEVSHSFINPFANDFKSSSVDYETRRKELLNFEVIFRQIEYNELVPNDKMVVKRFRSNIQGRWKNEMKGAMNFVTGVFKNQALEDAFNRNFNEKYGFLISLSSAIILFSYILLGINYIVYYHQVKGFAIGLPLYFFCSLLALIVLVLREWRRRLFLVKKDKKLTSMAEEERKLDQKIPFIDKVLLDSKIYATIFHFLLFCGTVTIGGLTFFDYSDEPATLFASYYVFLISSVLFFGAGSTYLNIGSFFGTVAYNIMYVVSLSNFDPSLMFFFNRVSLVVYSVVTLAVILLCNSRVNMAIRKSFQINIFLEEKVSEVNYINHEAERLLNMVLPSVIASRPLKFPDRKIAESFPEICVLFVSIANFRDFNHSSQKKALLILNYIICEFDKKCQSYGVEKIKSSGNNYMVMAGGLPCKVKKAPAIRITDYVLKLFESMKDINTIVHCDFKLKAGIHVGPAVGGVIGRQKFCFDIWGDSVNFAARMEQTCESGKIQITETMKNLIEGSYDIEKRGEIPIKGKGKVNTFYLLNKKQTIQ